MQGRDSAAYVQSYKLSTTVAIAIATSHVAGVFEVWIHHVCALQGPEIPTLLLDLINPYHPSPPSQFPFFSPYLLLHPPQSPLAGPDRLPCRAEALIQG